jgi:hypothetical protein
VVVDIDDFPLLLQPETKSAEIESTITNVQNGAALGMAEPRSPKPELL